MTLEVGTPALLFPAISLLFLSFTNRFLHLGSLIRHLHRDWSEKREDNVKSQIDNLRKRLEIIRIMQKLGAGSLILCVISMLCVIGNLNTPAITTFTGALLLMAGSLGSLLYEISISGGALRILLADMEKPS